MQEGGREGGRGRGRRREGNGDADIARRKVGAGLLHRPSVWHHQPPVESWRHREPDRAAMTKMTKIGGGKKQQGFPEIFPVSRTRKSRITRTTNCKTIWTDNRLTLGLNGKLRLTVGERVPLHCFSLLPIYFCLHWWIQNGICQHRLNVTMQMKKNPECAVRIRRMWSLIGLCWSWHHTRSRTQQSFPWFTAGTLNSTWADYHVLYQMNKQACVYLCRSHYSIQEATLKDLKGQRVNSTASNGKKDNCKQCLESHWISRFAASCF